MGEAVALIVEFSDGKLFKIPARFIAEDRARYYAKHDTGQTEGEEFEKEFKAEVEFALRESFEIIDWAANNMDWSDVVSEAVLIGQKETPSYEQQWTNAEKYVRVDALKPKLADDVIEEEGDEGTG